MVQRKKRKRRKISVWLLMLAIIFTAVFFRLRFFSVNNDYKKEQNYVSARDTVAAYAQKNNLNIKEYPDKLIELLSKQPEAKEFVLDYPFEKDKKHVVDISRYKNCSEVPLFIQWDKQWGYNSYGDGIIGLDGCGPVCMSMAAVYLLNDTGKSPDYMAKFAEENGYFVQGAGSAWTLITEGSSKLGMEASEIPLSKDIILNNLKAKNPIICSMKPGDFTKSGHFVVFAGCDGDLIKINDPNSYSNSEKLWSYDELKGQINNLWVLKKQEN